MRLLWTGDFLALAVAEQRSHLGEGLLDSSPLLHFQYFPFSALFLKHLFAGSGRALAEST